MKNSAGKANAMCELIDRQPTAYDVDKVLEKLLKLCNQADKDMQVDHAKPLRVGGADELDNMLPACRSCNHYKATLDVEGFREYLAGIHKRLLRDSVAYQAAERFGIVEHVTDDVVFYFEKTQEPERTDDVEESIIIYAKVDVKEVSDILQRVEPKEI